MADLLIELFSEEIPARMQARAADDLKKLVTDGMVERGLTYEAAAAFATPRRLTLSISGVLKETRAVREERKGPRVDAPEKALEGFLRSTGLTKDQLEPRDDKKGQVWFAIIEKPGRTAADIIGEVLPAAIRNFPWPRSMRWGAGDLRWVRPLHSIMCVMSDEAGAEVVPVTVDHIEAGAETYGHRFMAPDAVSPVGFDDYVAKLNAAKVVLDPAARRESIWADATNMAFAQGMEVVEDKGLLAEVAGLVEWPVVLMGDIEDRFLELPPEVLQTSMKEHQKFFSVRNPKTGRIEKFITVANVETADNGATILAGNQRVLAARLSDALFFWENDLRTIERGGMVALAAPLAEVTFHNKLGSEVERIERIAELASDCAPLLDADERRANLAAHIVKADLASEMVYEFPELQGIMGRYYAQHQGLHSEVSEACQIHYAPLGPSDEVPSQPVAMAVSLADKIDKITGFWSIDEKPTGSKDPFALRRAALGVIRIATENSIRFPLKKILDRALYRHDCRVFDKAGDKRAEHFRELHALIENTDLQQTFKEVASEALWREICGLHSMTKPAGLFDEHPLTGDIISFFADRLKVHLKSEGVRHDVIDACFQLGGQDDLVLLVNRVHALQAFVNTEDGANLLAGYKRASNILNAEQKKDGVEYTLDPDPKFAEGEEERALFAALDQADAAIRPALEAEDFAAAMTAMAALRAPIDAFFEKVVVNSDNPIVRRNRLCLLNRVKVVMERVAVFSAIEG